MRLHATRTFTVSRALPAAIEGLGRLSRNYYWCWNTEAAALFEQIDAETWRQTNHNPVRLLQIVSQGALERAADDQRFGEALRAQLEAFDHYMARPRLLDGVELSAGEAVAYFSFEFAITESLPCYSGGLGVLAGDHMKSASDLGLPLVGVGLLYREGYFHQSFAPDGWQTEEYREIDPAHHAVELVRGDAGEPLRVAVSFPGREVWCAVWRIDVGQAPLYLLDSDVEGNSAEDREIAARLYGGDIEMRIKQEMLLGIGGVKMLRALGLAPAVCHMNEGHSSLLAIERVREIRERTGASFEAARIPVTAATAFTTHTPVAAGIDLFPPELMRKYLGHYAAELGINERDLFALGRMDADAADEPFSMALLGLRLSGFRNGVSKLHGAVSRKLWAGAWPAAPEGHAPITHVTNGVHLPTWVSHDMAALYDQYLGRQWRDEPASGTDWSRVTAVPDADLWEAHTRQRQRLVARARTEHRETEARIAHAVSGAPLDPEALTIGFARRFASYKRATLLFRDLDRLARILNNVERPVQFIFAGKAHPRDEAAKALIKEVVAHSRRPELRDRLVILEHYDVSLARSLVQGCDIWLNTPLRPLEASGTSGMKAVANGALHMSVLDGWWAEAYGPGLGWAVGRDRVEDAPEVQDALDSDSIYTLLEDEVVRRFYDRDAAGLPAGWVAMMKASIAAHAPVFSTHRMVTEYARSAYLPGVRSWQAFEREGIEAASSLAEWERRVRAAWPGLKLLAVEDDLRGPASSEGEFRVTVQADWGELAGSDLRVDVLTGAADPAGNLSETAVTRLTLAETGQDATHRYSGTVQPPQGGPAGYAVRVTPGHPALNGPYETGLALWA